MKRTHQTALDAFVPRQVAPWDPAAIDPPETPDALLTAAKAHAEAVASHHELAVEIGTLDWEISKRAKRRAGAVKHNRKTGAMTVSLTWEAFERFGWEEFSATVRHELVHAEQIERHGEGDHGPTFYDLADDLDAPRHCQLFAQPKWWIECQGCGGLAPRYRRSKLVENTESHHCGKCGGSLERHPGDWLAVENYTPDD